MKQAPPLLVVAALAGCMAAAAHAGPLNKSVVPVDAQWVVHVDVEGLLKPEEAGLSAAERNPVFRTNIFRSEAVIPLGKPTVVGAMDDVASNRRYEIEVTATKVR